MGYESLFLNVHLVFIDLSSLLLRSNIGYVRPLTLPFSGVVSEWGIAPPPLASSDQYINLLNVKYCYELDSLKFFAVIGC